MCSCDSGSIYELRSSVDRPISPGSAVIDYDNFKPPGFASIKNPAGNILDVDLVTTNPWANRWWLKFYFMFKHHAGTCAYYGRPVISVFNNYGLQCYFQLVPVTGNQFSLTIVTGRKYSDGPDHVEPCAKRPMVEGVWYEIIVGVTHAMGDGWWEIWIDGADNVSLSDFVECSVKIPCVGFCRSGGSTWFSGSGDPRDRCCVCGCQSCFGQCYCQGSRCELPPYLCPNFPIEGCAKTVCPCHNDDDACYPRRQTQHGAGIFANRLLFGNEEGGAEGFDYWYDDIIFNDQAPYKHDNHAVIDPVISRPRFGSRLSLLRVDGAGDVADFVPIGSPNNWENIEELPVSIADYNKSGTLNAKDLYNIEPATGVLG